MQYLHFVDESPQTGSPVAEPIIDKIDSLRIVRADSDAERDKLLMQISRHGQVEHDVVSEMSSLEPLAFPDHFEEAHCRLVRGIEVLYRNGARAPKIRKLGFITPIARWMAQQGIHFIVRSHLQSLTKNITRLYEQREASCPWSSPEHSLLRRCRIDMRRVREGLDRNVLSLPTFIFGGAILTSLGSGLQNVIRLAQGSSLGVVIAGVVLIGVLIALSWVALYSAAVARRRIKLAVEQPLASLWETIGRAGKPPRDESYNFAVYAIILLVISWIIVPFAFWMAVVAA